MSRKDTIIIAVLINAGLLIVLFASALKSGPAHEDVLATSIAPPVVQEMPPPMFKKEMPAVAGDEVDQALNQFSQHSLVATSPTTPPTTSPMSAPPAPSHFADDLNPIAPIEPSVTSSGQTPVVQTLMAPIAQPNKSVFEFIEVKVKKGDVLEKIARHHHSTVAEIMKVNKLTSTNLRIGQVLKIPNRSFKKAEVNPVAYTAAPVAKEVDNSAKYYTVKKGDSPWTIAVKNQLKVDDLLKLNNMNEEQARRLKPGDQLRIK